MATGTSRNTSGQGVHLTHCLARSFLPQLSSICPHDSLPLIRSPRLPRHRLLLYSPHRPPQPQLRWPKCFQLAPPPRPVFHGPVPPAWPCATCSLGHDTPLESIYSFMPPLEPSPGLWLQLQDPPKANLAAANWGIPFTMCLLLGSLLCESALLRFMVTLTLAQQKPSLFFCFCYYCRPYRAWEDFS